jgi:flagella basal body P-ring formation protein FlgA
MTRITAVAALCSLAMSAFSGFAQSPDATRIRAALFTERFAGYPAAQPAPTHVIGSTSTPLAGPKLRLEAIVTSDLVRIGDLVDNAGAVADIAIFRAPDLGQTGIVPASLVVEAVRPHQIVGLDTRGIAEISVTRASRKIGYKEIEARLLRALSAQYGIAESANLAVVFDNEVRSLHVEPSSTTELRVQRLNYEPRTGRFDVSFELPGHAAVRISLLRYSGSIVETFEAAVPTRAIAAGETLNKTNLVIARRPKSEFSADAVFEPAQAVGHTARRGLRPGQVVRMSDLSKAEVIRRNEDVTISYRVPGIMLSMRGQALETGAVGDVINVLNVQSKKTIRATIAGPGSVTVAATAMMIAAPPRVAANAAATSSNSAR